MKKVIITILLLLSFNSVKALETTGSITLNFYDNLTKSQINSGLLSFDKTAIEIQKNDIILGLRAVKGKTLVYNDLEKGTYKLRFNLMSSGYEVNKEVYTFNIDGNNVSKDVYLNPITTSLLINKYYGNSLLKTKYPMENAIFNIYDENNKLVEKIYTNEKGIAETNLVYGQYKIIDENTGESYYIYKNMFANVVNKKTFFEEQYEAKIKLKLLESNTMIPLNNIKFIINDKEYKTNEEGIIITETLKEGLYKLEMEFIPNYYKTDDISILIDKNSNIYIDNNNEYIDVVIYKEKIYNVDSTSLNNDCDEKLLEQINEEEKLPYLHTSNNYIYINYLILLISVIYVKKVFN